MYGDENYYPGEYDEKSTDDFHSYGQEPDDRAIDMLAKRAKAMNVTPAQWAAPVGRVGNFANGVTSSRLTSAPNAVSRSAKEASDQRAGDAANLAADKTAHPKSGIEKQREVYARDVDQSDREYIAQKQAKAKAAGGSSEPAKRPNPKGLSDAEVAKRVARSQARRDKK